MKPIQLRGHCQVCGRWHAATDGILAHHGYKVEYGYFNGTCGGARKQPIETDTTILDATVAHLREEAPKRASMAARYEAGEITPLNIEKKVFPFKPKNIVLVPWAEVPGWEQRETIRGLVYSLNRQAEMLLRMADDLAKLKDTYHGKPLDEVTRPDAPTRIKHGERRKLPSGSIATAYRVEGRRIYWKLENGRTGWTAPVSWRQYPVDNAAETA